jgi:hypothetical protein
MQTRTDYRWWEPSRTIPLFGPNRRLLHSIAIIATIQASSVFVFTQTSAPSTPAAVQEVPGFIRRGLPGPGHAALRGLEGDWRVEKALYIAVGTREKPAVSSDLIARRHWIAGGRVAYAARKLDQSAARKVIHLRAVHSTLFSSETRMIGCGNVGISRAVRDFQAAVEIVL